MTYKYTILICLFVCGAAIAALSVFEDVWNVPFEKKELRSFNLSPEAQARQRVEAAKRGAEPGDGGDLFADEKPNDGNGEKPPTEEPKKKDHVELPGGGRLYLEPKEDRRVELDGMIVQQDVNIELVACSEGGKDHESVITVKCVPEEVHAALLLLGLRDKDSYGGGGPAKLGDPTEPVGDNVLVFIRWESDGKVVEHRAEDLTVDSRTGKTIPQVGWVFAGSKFVDEIDVETGKPTGRQIYLATHGKTLVATYHDPSSILDLPIGEDSNNLYFANGKTLPARGTRATLIVKPPKEEELKKLKAEQERVRKELQEKKDK
ncbi:MAG: YdjY domain-containing protein [Planctomycetota bacterium]|nr:YdjY domain-containing protein [Planctomycetota bacterium]